MVECSFVGIKGMFLIVYWGCIVVWNDYVG